jgi:WD40 repeat protein
MTEGERDESRSGCSLVRNIYTAVGVNSSPHCAAWSEAGLIYGAANAVAFVDGLRTDRIRTLVSHTGRVNAVRWGSNDLFVSASADATAIVWTRTKADEFAAAAVLSGHEDAVTVVDVSICDDSWLVASSSVDGSVRLWRVTSRADDTSIDTEQVLRLGRGLALDVRLFRLPKCDVLTVAVAMDDSSVRLFASDGNAADMREVQVLRGHDDWVSCIDVTTDRNGDVLLATASQVKTEWFSL